MPDPFGEWLNQKGYGSGGGTPPNADPLAAYLQGQGYGVQPQREIYRAPVPRQIPPQTALRVNPGAANMPQPNAPYVYKVGPPTGIQVPTAPLPEPTPQTTSDMPRPPLDAGTPISDAAQRIRSSPLGNLLDLGFPRSGVNPAATGLAVAQDIGDALAQFGAPTQGTEVTAAPVAQALQNVPGLNVGILAAQATSPDAAKALQTPLRDVPFLGGIVRGAETAAHALGASARTIAEPTVGALSAWDAAHPELRPRSFMETLGDIQQRAQGKTLAQIEASKFPSLAGTSPAEIDQLTRGLLVGVNTPAQNKRLETIARQSYSEVAEKAPIPALVATAVFDPLSYLDIAGAFNNIGRLQQVKTTLEATVPVGEMAAKIGQMSLFDRAMLHLFPTAKVDDIAKIAETVGAETRLGRRFLKPVAPSPQAMLTNFFKRLSDSILPFSVSENVRLADKITLLKLMNRASKEAKLMTPALREFISANRIPDTPDFYRAVRAAMEFDPERSVTLTEYGKMQELLAGLKQTQETTRPVYSEANAQYLRSAAETLPEQARTVFNYALDSWKEGKLDLTELDRQFERLAGYRLAAEFTENAGNALAKASGIPPPSGLTRLMNVMRAYEGVLYVGSAPSTIAVNVANNFAKLAQYGVTPHDLTAFWKRIGYEPPGNIGKIVSQAIGSAAQDVNVPFGGSMPKFLENVPVLKQMGALWNRNENWARAQAWAAGFERFMARNFTYGKDFTLPNEYIQHVLATEGEQGLARRIADLEHARNYTEAEKALLGSGRTWAAYRDEIAAKLSQEFGKPISGKMLDDALPLDMREKLNAALDEYFGRVDKGQPADQAWRMARANHLEEPLFPEAKPPTGKPPEPPEPTGPTTPPPKPPPTSPPAGGVPMITRGMERRLRDLGFPQEAINQLTPQDAQDILKAGKRVMGGRVTKDTLTFTDSAGKEYKFNRKPPEPPEAAAPQAERNTPAPEPPPTTPSAGGGAAVTPEDIQRQQDAWIIQQREPDPNVVADFAKALAQEEQVPNILRNTVTPDEWAQMDEYARQVALERALKQQETAGNFPLSDVYQGAGDVPTAMPDVTNVPPVVEPPSVAKHAPDLSDVFKRAIDKQIPTATEKGRTINQHLLNVLNKHKQEGAARFTTLDDVKARADEALKILDEYTPEVKAAPQVAAQAPTIAEPKSSQQARILSDVAKTPRHDLPTQLSQNMADAATELKFQLAQGEPGKRISYYNQEEGGRVFLAQGTTNPPWYSKLVEKYGANKDAVTTALNKIIKDKGADKGTNVERLKEIILRELADGLQTQAGKLPPDWEARALLGYSQDKVDEAFNLYRASLENAPESFATGALPPESTGRLTLSSGEPMPVDEFGRLYQQGNAAWHSKHLQDVIQRAKDEGAPAVLNQPLNQEWHDALTQTIADAIEQALSQDAQRAAGVIPPELEKVARQWLDKSYMPALNVAKQGANAAGRYYQGATVLNYDGRWNIDDGLALFAPFTFWWLHSLANYTKDFIDHPAMLAYYIHLREMLDKQSEGMPDRYKHRIELPMPLASKMGVGDTVWVDPLRTFFPAEELYQIPSMERASYQSIKEDGTVDFQSAFSDLFGIHTPYKLIGALVNQNPDELQNIVASIPAARLFRGATSMLTPGGLGLSGEYDRFYYERALKELVAEGKLTQEQAQIALLQQHGKDWDLIRQRAGMENYGIRELTAAVGFRGYAFTPGEQKYLEARKTRDQMLGQAVRNLGGNPNMPPEQQYSFLSDRGYFNTPEWQDFQKANPELGAASFVNQGYGQPVDQQQEARSREYEITKMWEAYHAAPELKQKLIAASLGDEFKALFLSKPTEGGRDYSKIPTKTLYGWANAMDVLLQPVAGMNPVTPDPFHVEFSSDAQNKAYQEMYDQVANTYGWDNYGKAWDHYYALKDGDPNDANAFMDSPEGKQLSAVRDFIAAFYAKNPDIEKTLERVGLRTAQAAAKNPQSAAFTAALTAVGYQNYDEYAQENKAYHAYPEKSQARRDYLASHLKLLRMYQISGAVYDSDQEMQKQQQYRSGGTSGSNYTYYPPKLPKIYTPTIPTVRLPTRSYGQNQREQSIGAMLAHLDYLRRQAGRTQQR